MGFFLEKKVIDQACSQMHLSLWKEQPTDLLSDSSSYVLIGSKGGNGEYYSPKPTL